MILNIDIIQGRRNGFGIGGAKKIFFYITLTYKRDTVFFISISVISKFTDLSVYFILTYIQLFISHYFQTLNCFDWQNIGGGGNCPPAPPPPVPTAMLLSFYLKSGWFNSTEGSVGIRL